MLNMMQRITFFLALLTPSFLFASNEGAETYMQSLGNSVVSVVSDDKLTESQIHDDLRAILERNFAVQAMAKFALGKYWKRASTTEKEEFIDLFRLLVVNNYVNRFESHTNEKFVVTGSRKEDDGAIIVTSELERPSGPPLPLDWRLYEKNGTYRVFDVIVDGISMSITLRSEYSSVIQKAGGKISGLNAEMRSKWNSRSEQ